jgi:hypothetical protein
MLTEYSRTGDHGVRVAITTDRQLTKDEELMAWKFTREIDDAVLAEDRRHDPEAIREASDEREQLLGLFDRPIYAEEIANGYCSLGCCKHLPWFVVTTTRGRFTVGRRKRVTHISWEAKVGANAYQLFPNEQVTKEALLIHAWNMEDARRYIRCVMEAPC